MSERLSDEDITLLEAALGKIENDYRSTCESVNYGNGCPGPTDESLDFWRRAVDCIPAMLAELRAAREVVEAAKAWRATTGHEASDHMLLNQRDARRALLDAIDALAGAK